MATYEEYRDACYAQNTDTIGFKNEVLSSGCVPREFSTDELRAKNESSYFGWLIKQLTQS